MRSLVYNYDGAAKGGETLVLVEGPVDALKLDVLGRPSVRAVGLMGVVLSPGKRDLVVRLVERFDRVCVLLDADAMAVALRLKAELGFLNRQVTLGALPEGVKDPGDLSSLEDVTLEHIPG